MPSVTICLTAPSDDGLRVLHALWVGDPGWPGAPVRNSRIALGPFDLPVDSVTYSLDGLRVEVIATEEHIRRLDADGSWRTVLDAETLEEASRG